MLCTNVDPNMNNLTPRFSELLRAVICQELSLQDFCRAYERLWNLEASTENLPSPTYALLSDLFDEVALYSPFPREQWGYPGYRTGEEILSYATKVLDELEEK